MIEHNNTPWELKHIESLPLLGTTVNKWRQRNIRLFEHPIEPTALVSVGETFDGSTRVIAEEPRSAWATALDYAARGKVYVSE